MTDQQHLEHLLAQIVAPPPPTARQVRRTGVLAADYALDQADPAGVLREMLAALALAGPPAGRPAAQRCLACGGPMPPHARRNRNQYCGNRCGGIGSGRTRRANQARRSDDAR